MAFVRFPGTAGNYVSTGDVPPLAVSGDFDLRMRMNPSEWGDAGGGRKGYIGHNTGASVTDWGLSDQPGSQLLRLDYKDASGTLRSLTADVSGVTGIHKLGLTLAFGANQSKWYIDDVQIGSTGLALGGGLFGEGTALTVGRDQPTSARYLTGDVYWAEIRDGIGGTVVARFDADDIPVP